MMLTALFGITDGSLNLAVNLLILVLVVVWLSLIYWTFADARRRIDDSGPGRQRRPRRRCFPFIGTIIYTILRPPEFLEDARERELEIKASELRLRRLSETSCPRCEHPIELSLAALPRVPAPAQGPVPLLRPPGRSALVRLPALRDPGGASRVHVVVRRRRQPSPSSRAARHGALEQRPLPERSSKPKRSSAERPSGERPSPALQR